VLVTALKKIAEDKREINVKIFDLVKETCVKLMEGAQEFREQVGNQVSDFIDSPDKRTADVVSSVPVLIA